MKVLFVDDDKNTTDLFELFGKYENVEIQTFTSGLDALKYLETNDADVIILDLILPVLDGLTIAEEIRRNEEIHHKPSVRMAFFTGMDINSAIEKVGERVGIKKIFSKPYDIQQLLCEIKTWFGETC